MTKLTPINPYEFQEKINQYAKDLVILFDSTIERYRVYQTFEPLRGFVMHDMTPLEARRQKLRLVFTIQEVDGSYREPDEGDLQRVIETVQNTITLNIKGHDFVTDQMERDDVAREESIAPGVQDAMHWGANEMYKIRTRQGILGFTK